MIDRAPIARHRAKLPSRTTMFALSILCAVMLVATAAITAAVFARPAALASYDAAPLPGSVNALPAPDVTAAEPTSELCELPSLQEALASGTDAEVIAAAGGAPAFRDAIANDRLPCVDLSDPSRLWFVVNKTHPFTELTWAPSDLTTGTGVTNPSGDSLRAQASAALTKLVQAGASSGDMAMISGFRSYETQLATFNNEVENVGVDAAELESARPGYSEHQSGLAVDLVPCDASGCGSLYDMGSSAQGAWLQEHSWEYGWIVRYESGQTDTTGYLSEPWHLRYIGPELARAYYEGGFHCLEDFFGLPASPDYS